MPVESDVERLRAAGLRVTRPRLAVLATVRDRPHLDADTITRLARSSLGRLSGQAVYDVLHALTGAGLLRRFAPAGGPARYEVSGADHDHLVCRECGAISDTGRGPEPGPCLDPSVAATFAVETTEVTYWGRCPDCQQRQRTGGER
ncbi:Fur family transcriptional regulator [Micromonospora okii]|uniref:Fur family transcriptional regulator n=1 Tax=Micromonospora okii TaxID=1182970 RepID=UPI001E5A4343|nr:Fur family transcriptional regulator [Micromonospora okii]